jgi:hypothetical protein
MMRRQRGNRAKFYSSVKQPEVAGVKYNHVSVLANQDKDINTPDLVPV